MNRNRYSRSSRRLRATLIGIVGLLAPIGCTPDDATPAADPPRLTAWAPTGARSVGSYSFGVIPEPNAFHTMHAGLNNSDNVWIAVAPMMELDWTVETQFFIPEGPTHDNRGNLYFSPLFPQENVSLVSLDAETGERNWVIAGSVDGDNAGSGAILILDDPDDAGEQIVYHATYAEAMALRPDGSEVWRVSTGLVQPPVMPGVRSTTHFWGFNYHPPTDSLIGLTAGGEIFALDRATGAFVAPVFQIPGSPAASVDPGLPQFVIDQSNALSDQIFGQTPSGLSIYEVIVDVIFGGGSLISNYFAVDANSGRIFVAATADDADDGTLDGVSELGAIYSIELVDDTMGGWVFSISDSATFVGGTGSTPTVSEDGSRIYVSDNLGNVIALDPSLNEIWSFDVGKPVAASVAVSPDNFELYVVTRSDIFRLTDLGGSARLDWTANLTAFVDDPTIEVEFNALTPTIGANGVAVSVGGGTTFMGQELMQKVGIGLLDRETGDLRSFALGREESISVTSVGPDGGVYTCNSPVRRVSARALTPTAGDPVIGGVSRYRPIRNDILARDAICAAEARAANAAAITSVAPDSASRDLLQIRALITQSRAAIERASIEGSLDRDDATAIDRRLDTAEASLTLADLGNAAATLDAACASLIP